MVPPSTVGLAALASGTGFPMRSLRTRLTMPAAAVAMVIEAHTMLIITGHTATAYLNPFFGHHVAIAPVTSPFTAHPNGALVPAEPADVVEAREAHLAAVAEAGRKKREAQVPVNLVTGLAATTYINPFFGHHLAVAPVTSPFTAYPNGALVPEEPADVAEARAAHLEALAAASK